MERISKQSLKFQQLDSIATTINDVSIFNEWKSLRDETFQDETFPVFWTRLPRVPIGRERTQDDFWLQQGNSGAINAFRQLTSTRQKGGRKKAALPGGKLKPLFKNHAGPPRSYFGNPGARQVLPGITSPTIEPSSTTEYVMSGYLDDLPPEDPTTVRVYLCSNYDDMKAERAILMKKAVPELQNFCGGHGLHFQLIDLHWGVVGGAHYLGSSSDLRIKEIKACQRLSLGPAFVMLLGDKYGPPRIPPAMSLFEFEVLTSVAGDNWEEDAELLSSCYTKDDNAIPSCYVLDCQDNPDELFLLDRVLKETATAALHLNRFTQDQYEKLTISILEEEIEQGVFSMKDPRQHCLMYRREWQHVDETHIEASNLIDIKINDNGDEVRDIASQKRNCSLVKRITQHLGSTQCKSYYLQWSEHAGQTWAPTPEFQKHLDILCTDFINDCKHLVMQGLERVGENKAVQLSVYSEVLYQSHLWSSKSAHFHGQKFLVFKIESFLQDPHRNMKPYVIYGPPSTGKTSTMAHLAEKLRASSTANCVVVLRFLGTSAESSNIHTVVVGMTTQICMAYGLCVPKMDIYMNTLYKALQTFRSTIEAVSGQHASARPLYILLDGIDQLQPLNESLRAVWAICDLPHNVHLIISMVEQVGQINLISAFQNFVCGENASAPMEPLSSADAKAILHSALQSCERKITPEQESKLLAAYEANPNPLYLKTLVRGAQRMKSFDSGDHHEENLASLFHDFLESLEDKYGTQTIQNITSYISISGVGIHEKELLDLLLCDEEVMEEASRVHILHPDGVAGYPHILWAAIKDELQDFLEEHSAYGITVLGWNHVLYCSALADRLGIIYPGIDESKITTEGTTLTLGLHEYVTNMYLHETEEHHSNVVSDWAVPDLAQAQTTAQTPSLSHLHNAILISPQPTNVHNVLKLQKLPLHLFVLIPIEGLQRLTDVMFGSLSWLKTKLKAVSVQSVLHDLAPVITLSKHFLQEGIIENGQLLNDLEIILEFLQLAQDALIMNPDSITQEVLARLPDLVNKYPTVASLVDQARSWLAQTTSPYLSPVYPCLPQPNNPLRHSFQDPTHMIGFLQKKNLGIFLCHRSSIDIWKLNTGELLHRFPVNPEQAVDNIIPMNNEEYIIIPHYSHLKHVMELCVWGIETGIQVLKSSFEYRFEAVALDPHDKQLMVSTVLENDRMNEGGKRCLLGVDIHTRNILVNIIVEDIHKEGIAKIIFASNVHEGHNGLLTIGSKFSKDLAFWDLATEQLCFHLELDCYVDHVKVVPEDNLAVVASSDSGTVIVVDLESGEIRQKVSNAEYMGFSSMYVSHAAEHVMLGTKQHGIVIISLLSESQTKYIGEMVKFTLRPSNGRLPTTLPIPTQIAVDDEEYFVFVGCLNGAIKIYNIATGDHVDTLNGHKKTINNLMFDKCSHLYSASDDGISRVWQVSVIFDQYMARFSNADVEEWDGVRQFEEVFRSKAISEECSTISYPREQEEVKAVAITSDRAHIVTASASSPVKLWEVDSGGLVRIYKEGSEHGASHVYLAYNDQYVVAHCHHFASIRTSTLQVWWRETGEAIKLSEKPVLAFTSCETPSGFRLFTVSPSNKKASGIVLGLYDLCDPHKVASLPCNIHGAMDSTNMQLLGCAVSTPFQADSSAMLTPPPEIPLTSSSTGPNQNMPAQNPSSDAEGGEEATTYAVLDYFPEPNVSYFFTFVIGAEKVTMDWHVPLQMDTQSPSCTVLTTGAAAISGVVDGSLVEWDVRGHTVLSNLTDPALERVAREGGLCYPSSSGWPAHDGPVTCVRLNADKTQLVTGGMDKMVKVWSVIPEKALLKVLGGHAGTILSVDVSADAHLVVSGSTDKTVAIWNTDHGNRMAEFCTHCDSMDVNILSSKSRVIAISRGNLISLRVDNM